MSIGHRQMFLLPADSADSADRADVVYTETLKGAKRPVTILFFQTYMTH